MDSCSEAQSHSHAGRRESDVVLATLTAKLSTMHADMSEIKSSVKDLTQAVTKLALIEERQVQSSQEMSRIFKTLEKHDDRLSELEIAASNAARTSGWVDKALWSIAAAACVFVAAKAGLL